MKTSLVAPGNRRRLRSQSVVEFTLILPFFMALVCGLLDFGFMVSNANRLALCVREGANIVSRTDLTADDALTSMVMAAYPELDFTNNGAIIISYLNRGTPSTMPVDQEVMLDPDPNISTNLASLGNVFGTIDNLRNQSRLLQGLDISSHTGPPWTYYKRRVPYSTANLVNNQKIYVVEAFITNRFITPIGELLSYGSGTPFQPPPFLYDAAYF